MYACVLCVYMLVLMLVYMLCVGTHICSCKSPLFNCLSFRYMGCILAFCFETLNLTSTLIILNQLSLYTYISSIHSIYQQLMIVSPQSLLFLLPCFLGWIGDCTTLVPYLLVV